MFVYRLIKKNTAKLNQTGRHRWIDPASDPDQDYVYFLGSETLYYNTSYTLPDKSIIPFNSTIMGIIGLRLFRLLYNYFQVIPRNS